MSNKINEHTDEELLELTAKGSKQESQQAFGELYNRYSTMVYTYCNKYLQDNHKSKDIFQDTFIKFYNVLKEEKEIGHIGGYLTKIARNLCLNEVKKKHNEFAEFEEKEYLPEVSRKFEDKEYKQLLDEALQSLPYEYKEYIILKEFLDMKYKEIADLMETNIANVRTKIYRAKQMLRDYLKVYIDEYNKINK